VPLSNSSKNTISDNSFLSLGESAFSLYISDRSFMRILKSSCYHLVNLIVISNNENFSSFFTIKLAHFMHN
ncbi:MAG TPA: hypothetical protein VFP25_05220, partial [Nitrososphaeraceae archaeon]|nr:hypothetical protein [Nitrososphaeraceae archaeon]